jgi:hypothetical protein
MDEETAPDERADASQDDAQLIDGGPWRSGRRLHALSVAQYVASLKDSPRILVLSRSYCKSRAKKICDIYGPADDVKRQSNDNTKEDRCGHISGL